MTLETGSHHVSQYIRISTGIHGAIHKLQPHHCALWPGSCCQFASPGQVHAKHAGPHLSHTNLSWSHLTKIYAPNIQCPLLKVLWK